jgi:hypothetical protein
LGKLPAWHVGKIAGVAFVKNAGLSCGQIAGLAGDKFHIHARFLSVKG